MKPAQLLKTGGPAFPVNESSEDGRGSFNIHDGITVRDYFAAAALQGMLADRTLPDATPEFVAPVAYAFADAMLEQRRKP